MENYIFVTGRYLPKPGATGLCIHQIAKEAASRGINTTTICYSDGIELHEADGVYVDKISTPYYLRKNKSANKIIIAFNHISSIFNKLVHIHNYPVRSIKLINSYENAIQERISMCGTEDITIIASVNPIEAVIAVSKIKKKYRDRVYTVYYCADTLSNEKGISGILPMEYRTNCGIKWERTLFSIFDKILIMDCHKTHYLSELFSEYTNKMKVVNFPLLSYELYSSSREKKTKSIHMVYTGSLYRVLRNPTALCRLLAELSERLDINVSFMGPSDCNDIIEGMLKNTKCQFEILGMQSHEIAQQFIRQADVLLSIGNKESPMAPSKIFEYISTGKPILHTYTYLNDTCLEPLQKYENSLLINENEDLDINRVMAFFENWHTLKFEKIRDIFFDSSPAFTLDQISKL